MPAPRENEPTAVWSSMAEHFLDTETRHALPLTALACLDAGLSVDTARAIWFDEITPAVGDNLLDVAGDWAGWPDDWLFDRIREARRAGPLRRLVNRVPRDVNANAWRVVEACMPHLQALPEHARRERAEDLVAIARHAFDFGPEDVAAMPPERRRRLRALYPQPFHALFAPVFYGGEHERDLTGTL